MSKEREGFEAWALGRWSMLQHPNGEYVYNKAQAAWLGFQQATAHYQPLLEAKDAEIAGLREENEKYLKKGLSYCRLAGEVTEENTTLKALLEQAREGLEKTREPLHQAFNRIHCLPRGTDTALASRIDNAFDTVNRTLAAINAATGEK